jgi:hypothetical protein
MEPVTHEYEVTIFKEYSIEAAYFIFASVDWMTAK